MLPLWPEKASVAVTVQLPATLPAVKVVVAGVTPFAGLSVAVPPVGQAVPDMVKCTWSPMIAVPAAPVTVALTVLVPPTLMVLGLAFTETAVAVLVVDVWSSATVPTPPTAAAVAVIVQKPGMVEEL